VILVDTSVWIDHFRSADRTLATYLLDAQVACHPFVVGELAVGSLRRRAEILRWLEALPAAPVVSHTEVMLFVETYGLAGVGLGWIDVHLLASACLAGHDLWTNDRRLEAAARRLGLAG
jgi:predicted nucleic acid-binding protein